MTVAIIDYGSGNLHSARKAFERAAREAGLKREVKVTSRPEDVGAAGAGPVMAKWSSTAARWESEAQPSAKTSGSASQGSTRDFSRRCPEAGTPSLP